MNIFQGREKRNTESFSLRFSEETYGRIASDSQRYGISMAQVVRSIVEAYYAGKLVETPGHLSITGESDTHDVHNETEVSCPACGDAQCQDIGEIRIHAARGGCTDLASFTYGCCCGEEFDLVVHNHKGTITLYTRWDEECFPIPQGHGSADDNPSGREIKRMRRRK